jgi:hypothetical protein
MKAADVIHEEMRREYREKDGIAGA